MTWALFDGIWWQTAAKGKGGHEGGKNGAQAGGKGQDAGKGGKKGGKAVGKGERQDAGKSKGGGRKGQEQGGTAGGKSGSNPGRRPEPFFCQPCDGYKNFGFRTHCFKCNRNRAKAILPVESKTEVSLEDDEGWSTGGLTTKERKKAKWQLQLQAKRLGVTLVDPKDGESQEKPTAGGGPKPTRYTPTTPEMIGEPPKVSIHAFGLAMLPTMKEPKKAFQYPEELVWEKTAEEEVSAHAYCANATKMADAKERESDYIDLLQRIDARTKKDPAHAASTRKLLTEVRAEIATLTGKGSSNGGKAAIEGMKAKLQEVTFAESKRVEQVAADWDSMESKMNSMNAEFKAQIMELQRRHDYFNTCSREVEEAWTHDENARLLRFKQTCNAWNVFIKDAEESLPVNGTEAVAKPEEAVAKPVEAAKPVEVALATPEEVTEEKMEEEELRVTREETDYALWAPWSSQDLPEVRKPKDDEAAFWLHLGAHVMSWSEQHACAPCTYQQLIGPGDPQILMTSMVKLIGKEFWTSIYGDRIVLASDVVPRHVGFVLYCALQKPYQAAQDDLGKDAAEKAKEMAKTDNVKAIKDMKAKQEKDKKHRKGAKGTLAASGK